MRRILAAVLVAGAILIQGCGAQSESRIVVDYLTALSSGELDRAQDLVGGDLDALVDEYYEAESRDVATAYFSQLKFKVGKSVKTGDRSTVPVDILLPDYDAILDQVVDEAVTGILEADITIDFDEFARNLADALRQSDAPTTATSEEFTLAKIGGDWVVLSGPFLDGEFATGLDWIDDIVALEEDLFELRDEIEKTKRKIAEAETDVSAFSVDTARFYWDHEYVTPRPVVEMTVTNNTPHAIARVYFRGAVYSEGRSIPWVEEDFDFSIDGGIEPSETATLRVELSPYGSWRRVPDQPDLIVEARPTSLVGAEQKVVWKAPDLPLLQRQLSALEEDLEAIEAELREILD